MLPALCKLIPVRKTLPARTKPEDAKARPDIGVAPKVRIGNYTFNLCMMTDQRLLSFEGRADGEGWSRSI
jgi:hypothetical protein